MYFSWKQKRPVNFKYPYTYGLENVQPLYNSTNIWFYSVLIFFLQNLFP